MKLKPWHVVAALVVWHLLKKPADPRGNVEIGDVEITNWREGGGA